MQYYKGDAGSSLETLLTNQRVQEARCLRDMAELLPVSLHLVGSLDFSFFRLITWPLVVSSTLGTQ